MRIWFLSFVILLCVAWCDPGVAQTWHIDDQGLFSTPIADLPKELRHAIDESLAPEFAQMVSDQWLDENEVRKAKDNLFVEVVTTPSGKMVLVQGWGSELCGAVGNCQVWVLGADYRVLLRGVGTTFTLLRAEHHGRPSIRISQHMSAWESRLAWYRFDGFGYRNVLCETSEWTWYEPHPRRQIERVSCPK